MSFGADDASAGVLAGGASGTGAVGCAIEGESNVVLVAVVVVFGGGFVALDAKDGEFSMTLSISRIRFPSETCVRVGWFSVLLGERILNCCSSLRPTGGRVEIESSTCV